MQKSSLIQLLLSLSKADRRALRKFVVSPFHNKRQDVSDLYFYIDQHLDKKWSALNREKAFQQLFPGEAYDDQKLRYVMSFLLKTIEQYLIIQQSLENEVEADLQLLKAYRQLNQAKAFTRNFTTVKNRHQSNPFRNIGFYEQNLRLENEQYLFSERQKRQSPRNLDRLNESLDVVYLARKLKQSSLQLAHQAVYNIEYDTSLLKVLLDYLEDSPYLEYPLVALYFYYYKAASQPEKERFFYKFKAGIIEHGAQFPQKELRELYLFAINYCIRKFNTGNEEYLREVFELYRIALERDILLEQNQLSRFAFKNIVGIALRLNEFAWTEQFIEQFAEKLGRRFQENYVHFCLSKLRYTEGKFKEAMLRLQQVEYDDIFLNLDAKVMLLKMYYDLEEYEALDSLLTSIKRFLQRQKLIGYHQENYLNIIRFTRKILELNPYDKTAQATLRTEIKNTKALAERDWLLQKINY